MTVRDYLRERCESAGWTVGAQDGDLSSGALVVVRKGAARSLKAGGAWIYDNEIDHVSFPADVSAEDARGTGSGPGHDFVRRDAPETDGRKTGSGPGHASSMKNALGQGPVPGAVVRVEDFDGFLLGYGIYNPLSKIRVRMLARYEKDGITPELLKRRVEAAWEYRKAVMGKDAACCRVIFGEADFLPGLTVDRFSDVLVIESLALGTDRLKELILLDLVEILEKDGIVIRGIYERSDARVRLLEGMERTKGFIGPEFDTMVPIVENGIRYLVDVKDGQKTGFFLDQKYNRSAVAKLVSNLAAMRIQEQGGNTFTERERGEEDGSASAIDVLDCFTHTGSFGLNAAAAGAGHVLSVDVSASAIEAAKRNAVLNGLENVMEYQVADVFELLPRLKEAHYDVVILDPPAFTKSRQATKNAVKGYREINLRGMKLVKDGGYLATCSCSHFMDEELLKKTLREAAKGAGRRLRQVEFRTQAPDHPILWGEEESYYLKFFLFQVMREL